MSDFTLGQHQASIERILADQSALWQDVRGVRSDITEIKTLLAGKEGEHRAQKRMAALIGGVAGAVLSSLPKLMALIAHHV